MPRKAKTGVGLLQIHVRDAFARRRRQGSLGDIICGSYTSAETEACRRRHKNAAALHISLKESERLRRQKLTAAEEERTSFFP